MEFQRQIIYSLARRSGARLLVVRTLAPVEVVRERLACRQEGAESASDADWRVYHRMAHREQRIQRTHVCVDTSQDTEDGVRKAMRLLRRGTRR